MPELPEVETVRRQLAPHLVGRVVERLEVLDARWSRPRPPAELADAVSGRTIEALGRRGKYLEWDLGDELFLLTHLRMTGTLLYDPPDDTSHVRARFALGDGHRVWFRDPRRFGTGELMAGVAQRDAFYAARLGIEPLGGVLDGPALRAMARGRTAPIKAFLLDQRRIAGVGNIYADEALWRAQVHPWRAAGSLRAAQYDAIAAAVVDVLEDGIRAGGATIDDYRHPDGVSGGYQKDFAVYDRAGVPCRRCGTPIVKTMESGRGTYFCRRCQPRPRQTRFQAASSSRRPASSASSTSR